MMMQRARLPDSLAAGELEVDALHDHLSGDHHEKTPNEDEQQFGAREHGEGGESATESERPRVAHHDLSGRRVPPEESD